MNILCWVITTHWCLGVFLFCDLLFKKLNSSFPVSFYEIKCSALPCRGKNLPSHGNSFWCPNLVLHGYIEKQGASLTLKRALRKKINTPSWKLGLATSYKVKTLETRSYIKLKPANENRKQKLLFPVQKKFPYWGLSSESGA